MIKHGYSKHLSVVHFSLGLMTSSVVSHTLQTPK